LTRSCNDGLVLLLDWQINAPEGLDFGFCTVKEESSRTFQLINTGQVRPPSSATARTQALELTSPYWCGLWQVPAPFRWVVSNTFHVEPEEGEIPVQGAQTIRVFLTPVEASVYVCSALCYVGEGVNAIKPQPLLNVKFSAIAKYPHLTTSEEKIDFGDVLIGSKGVRLEAFCQLATTPPPSLPAPCRRIL
jgi:hypothetical protein